MGILGVAGVRHVLKIIAGDEPRHAHWERTIKDSYTVLQSVDVCVGNGGQWKMIRE